MFNGSFTIISKTVGELLDGFYYNETENKGVYGLNGKLIIQPDYQRNYIYAGGRDVAVIESIFKNCPINSIHFNVLHNSDKDYDLLDGQQRLTSIGRFISNKFHVNIDKNICYWDNLSEEQKNHLKKFVIGIYVHDGDASYIKYNFKRINEEGTPVNDQEELNCVYSGYFVNQLRQEFSNATCVRIKVYEKYMKGSFLRQDFLKSALDWVSSSQGKTIEEYMSQNQFESQAADHTISYVNSVISWIDNCFTSHYKEMKSLPWGKLYEKYKNNYYDSEKINLRVNQLYLDPFVKNKKGIFEFVLNGEQDTNLLDIRLFDEGTKHLVYKKQTENAVSKNTSNCPLCASGENVNKTRIYQLHEMEADHVKAWSKGGSTTEENCEMLCKDHNRSKGNK